MSGSDAKFRQMQDEMSRFEEEIGLPIPIGGSLPRPPTKPLDVPPPPPPPPFLPPQLRPMGSLPPPPPIPPGFNMMGSAAALVQPSPATFSSPPSVTSRSATSVSSIVVESKPQPATPVLSATPMLYTSQHVDLSVYHPQDTPSAVLLREYYDTGFEEYARKAANPPPTPLLSIQTTKIKKNSDIPPLPFQYQYPPSKRKDKKNKKLIRTAGGQSWEDPTLAEWEEDDFRLFCGDLGNDVTDEVLTRAFSKYPSFLRARVVRDKRTNKTKGFGFVSFKDPQDFIRATKEMNGRYVGSRPIKLRKSTWKNRSLDVVRKKDKEKTALINMLTGR